MVSTAGWYSIKVDIDATQASGSRGRIVVNNTDETLATETDQSDILALSATAYIGHDSNASDYMDGLIYSAAVFSGSIPDDADVIDGSSGKLKNLEGLTGLHSMLDASTATFDRVLPA